MSKIFYQIKQNNQCIYQDNFILMYPVKALYSQQKQDQDLIVAQIMNPLLANSDLN